VKLISLSDRLSRESVSSISSAGVVPARAQRKALRLRLVSILLMNSDQHLVLNYVPLSMSCSKLLRSSGSLPRCVSMVSVIGFLWMISFCSGVKGAKAMASGRFLRAGDWRTEHGDKMNENETLRVPAAQQLREGRGNTSFCS
jgi:hypothetical protein